MCEQGSARFCSHYFIMFTFKVVLLNSWRIFFVVLTVRSIYNNVMKSLVILAILISSVFIACENQNQGDIRTGIKFAAVHGRNPGASTRKASTGEGILIDSAKIVLRNINLLTQNSNGQIAISANTSFPGPYLINLITHRSDPVIESGVIIPGMYYGIYASLYVPQNPAFSFYVRGTYTLNEKWWRFSYSNSGTGTFQVVDSAGFPVNGTDPDIWIMIDVISLFNGVDFSKATVDNDGVIRINEYSNPSLALMIQNNFKVSAAIGNDTPQNPVVNTGSGDDTGSSGSVGNNSNNSNQDKNKDGNDKPGKNKNKGQKSKQDHKDNNKSKDKNNKH